MVIMWPLQKALDLCWLNIEVIKGSLKSGCLSCSSAGDWLSSGNKKINKYIFKKKITMGWTYEPMHCYFLFFFQRDYEVLPKVVTCIKLLSVLVANNWQTYWVHGQVFVIDLLYLDNEEAFAHWLLVLFMWVTK